MAAEERRRKGSWRAESGPYLGDISALAFLPLSSPSRFPLLLAGTGSQILAYDVESGKLLASFDSFRGVRVHGISVCGSSSSSSAAAAAVADSSTEIAVFGERSVKLLRVHVTMAPGGGDGPRATIGMELAYSLPRFDHWVLDALFLKGDRRVAIGLSNNSIAVWDVAGSNFSLRVKSPERCLLYSMRLWGDSTEALHIASGTIYNEIIVWKLVKRSNSDKDSLVSNSSFHNDIQSLEQHYAMILLNRLTGHEGSIFRIAWSSDGSKLLSVSDDRSARIWLIEAQKQDDGDSWQFSGTHVSDRLALFGHNARIWDCHISDSIVITVGEDCTCRVWGMDSSQLMMVKEHTGRGIWRCLYDPITSLLITAGFDSAIKVHLLPAFSPAGAMEKTGALKDFKDKKEIFSICTPNVSEQLGLMDSKSEYVRCLRFTQEDTLYVATNNGHLYHVKLSNPQNVRWTELARISDEVPIICMDLMSMNWSDKSEDVGDMVAIGDGKGNAMVVRVISSASDPKATLSFTWSAERERQLLGVYWCKPLGCSHLFTVDPKGTLKLWRLGNVLKCVAKQDLEVPLVAIFSSSFRARIMCLAASVKEEVLVCGDQRGNIIVFPLSSTLLVADPFKLEKNLLPLIHFKGAHGISSVASILIGTLNSNEVEIRTTGGDGCICYFNYNRNSYSLEFLGMKQVKELSIIQTVIDNFSSTEDSARGNYAVGFASADFIVWNLTNELKILEVPCGGWRRPYSFYFGGVPEIQNCFAFLKDQRIHIHRLWVPASEGQLLPQVLHMQYHGREIHSLCFLSFGSQLNSCKKDFLVSTGCEDGTVRLTRYTPFNVEQWAGSKLLGEHVGGSAVRSICFVSKIYISRTCLSCMPDVRHVYNSSSDRQDDQFLLISVGAKQVLTSWFLRPRRTGNGEEACNGVLLRECTSRPSPEECSSMSFQWLSTHIPSKLGTAYRRVQNLMGITECTNINPVNSPPISAPHLAGNMNANTKSTLVDKIENDWRYLAVTAFLVKGADSRCARDDIAF